MINWQSDCFTYYVTYYNVFLIIEVSCILYNVQNYFEELVSVRDTQLSRMQSEMATYTEESEKQKKELEAIVLELQDQV